MTLRELLQLIKRYAKFVVGMAVVGLLIGAVVGCVSGSVRPAESSLTVADASGSLSTTGLIDVVDAVVLEVVEKSEDEDTEIEIKHRDRTNSIVFVVDCGNEEESVALANALAIDSGQLLREKLDAQAEKYQKSIGDVSSLVASEDSEEGLPAVSVVDKIAALRSCIIITGEADIQEDSGAKESMLSALAGLIGGVFASLVALALFFYARKPVIDEAMLEEAALPRIIGVYDGSQSSSNAIGMNLALQSDGWDSSICLIPVSGSIDELCVGVAGGLNALVSLELYEVAASGEENVSAPTASEPMFRVCACDITKDFGSCVLTARSSDLVVVCVRLWSDSLPSVNDVFHKLSLANIEPDFLVLVK